jgi:aryl-alcohol dehydrogenase-like predicted oxidoreductase
VQTDPKLIEIAQAIKITPTQLALSWAVQRGTSIIPKSSNLERLRSNLESMCISIRKSKTFIRCFIAYKLLLSVVELSSKIMGKVKELEREA